MNLEEAKIKLKPTKEEIGAIKRYMGFQHTSINILGDLNPQAYVELSKSGWLLPENAEDLEKAINDFALIYSLIYKSKGESLESDMLFRGTSASTARKLEDNLPYIVSTSYSPDVAKTFAKYGDAALLRIIPDGAVCLDLSPYQDADRADEQEVLFAPFTTVKRVSTVKEDSATGYSIYSVRLGAPELPDVSGTDMAILKSKVKRGYTEHIANMKKYMQLMDRLEIIDTRLSRAFGNTEEIRELNEERSKVFEEAFNIDVEISEYKKNLTTLLQGMCKEREREVEEAHQTIAEENRKEIVQNVQAIVETTPKNAQLVKESISKTWDILLETEAAYIARSSTLGLNLSGNLYGSSIEGTTKAINFNLDDTIALSSEMEITGSESLSAIMPYARQAAEFNKLDNALSTMFEVRPLLDDYSQELDSNITKAIYSKLAPMIRAARSKHYESDSVALSTQKGGIFDRISGKKGLREAQVQNLHLKADMAQIGSDTLPEGYGMIDILADAYECIDDNGAFISEDFIPFVERVRGDFSQKDPTITIESIKEYIEHRKEIIPTAQEDTPKKRTKQQTEDLQKENTELQETITQKKSEVIPAISNIKVESSVLTQIASKLSSVEQLTSTSHSQSRYLSMMQQKALDEDITLGRI